MDEINSTLVNKTVLDMLATPGQEKRAQDAINDYTRMKIREDGIWRRILPPVQITHDELDRQVDTDKPVKVVDREPDSPAAISVPFATLPMNRYIRGNRYRVMFDRILTPKFTKDVSELYTYHMDIRQILSDNSIKDALAEEDRKALAVVNVAVGTANVAVADTGTPQYVTISGGVTRDTIAEAFKVLPRSNKHLNVATVLVNNVTVWDVCKQGRDEVGGDLSENMYRTGFAETELLGARWIKTIKTNLVPDSTIFLFAEPKFLGKFFVLEDITMYIDRKAYMLEFFAYESVGSTVANSAAVGRVDFTA